MAPVACLAPRVAVERPPRGWGRVRVGVGVGVGVGAMVGAAVGATVGVGRTTTWPLPPHGRTHIALTVLVLGHAAVDAAADTHTEPAGMPAGHATGEPAGTVHVPATVVVTLHANATLQAGVGVGVGLAVAVAHGFSQVRRVSTTDLQPAGGETTLKHLSAKRRSGAAVVHGTAAPRLVTVQEPVKVLMEQSDWVGVHGLGVGVTTTMTVVVVVVGTAGSLKGTTYVLATDRVAVERVATAAARAATIRRVMVVGCRVARGVVHQRVDEG